MSSATLLLPGCKPLELRKKRPYIGYLEVNFFSGSYSGDYADVERAQFLKTAVFKIRSLFPYDKFEAF